MPGFEVLGKCEVNPGVTTESVLKIMQDGLSKYYKQKDIKLTESSLVVSGDLKGVFERAITEAEATVEIVDGQLSYRAVGETSLGGWPWFWLFVDLCANIVGIKEPIFTAIFLFFLIEYIVCSDRPKKYFEQIFELIKFRVE